MFYFWRFKGTLVPRLDIENFIPSLIYQMAPFSQKKDQQQHEDIGTFVYLLCSDKANVFKMVDDLDNFAKLKFIVQVELPVVMWSDFES